MFDWKFYLFLYPELLNNGIDSKVKAYEHWKLIGKRKNLICEH